MTFKMWLIWKLYSWSPLQRNGNSETEWIYTDMLITIWDKNKWTCKLKGTIVLFPEENDG